MCKAKEGKEASRDIFKGYVSLLHATDVLLEQHCNYRHRLFI